MQEGKEGEPEKQHEQEEEGRRRSYKMIIGYQGKAQVEGANGDGFLDGEMEDYRTTGILATDCKFAIFQGPEGPLSLS
ncbi:hypothetical protein CBR_g50734 [Chara braunii]|uniref:Uncharacterized protein n=1 Tax=Chara braunii TaxID=69332 RepID=A0A388K602_CHABU|nr:hypothetical protein CBR_g50734 [Chara braunii]|eukprot:GBG65373.1 hypothetical protein CBR_g50734 [Chara braunii]